jgi:hypothetical protein
MRRLSEPSALARLQGLKAAFQSHVVRHFEHAARDCRTCPTAGSCCTDAHFVNVHITRLEAMAVRETLRRTPRLTEDERRATYARARAAVERYHLSAAGDTFAQTYSCPLYAPGRGCLVHRRAKPAPCIQHACYDRWEDVPPNDMQWRTERRVEQLNMEAYGAAWAWLPTPLWLTLVDPDSDGAQLARLTRVWETQRARRAPAGERHVAPAAAPARRSLPVIAAHKR